MYDATMIRKAGGGTDSHTNAGFISIPKSRNRSADAQRDSRKPRDPDASSTATVNLDAPSKSALRDPRDK